MIPFDPGKTAGENSPDRRRERLGILRPVIDTAAARAGIDRSLVVALVLTENHQMDPLATRFEPGFWSQYIEPVPAYRTHPWYAWPKVMASSYGLCQVMFTTAEWARDRLGIPWSGGPWDLFQPDLNLRLGAAILAHKIARYGKRDGVAAYNSGKPRHDLSGTLTNEVYVRRFEGWLGANLA